MSATYESVAVPRRGVESTPTQARDIELDFVRGIAILLAMGRHFNGSDTGFLPLDLLLLPGRVIGWAGVDLFFVLSGFLVGGLVFKEIRQTGTFQPGRFLVRRALKIWPILYFYLLLLLVTGRHPWQEFLFQTLLHVQNYFVTRLDHLWSLAVEEHFYTAVCLAFVVMSRFANARRRVFWWSVAAIFVACLVLRSAAYRAGWTPTQIQWQTQFRIDALTCGVVLAYLYRCRRDVFNRLSARKPLLALGWVCGACLLYATEGDDKWFRVGFGYTVAYLTAACFLLFCHRLPALTHGSLPVRAIAFLGVFSYAMYVYQFVGMRAAEAAFERLGLHDLPVAVDLAVKYAGAIVVAVVLTKLIERPFLRLRDRLYPSRAL